MNNIPLHPLVVHFPIVLAVLLPFAALVALYAIRRQARLTTTWAIPLAITIMLLGSAFAATRTGEAEEDRVEEVVPKSVLHQHEEAAETFLAIAAIVMIVAAAGLVKGPVGSVARALATAGSVVVLFAGFQVGKAGGELVYQHNAASVYAPSSGEATMVPYDLEHKEDKNEDD